MEIDRFLIGDNPFIGVSHLSQERSRERSFGLSIARIVNIVEIAFQSGAEGLAFSTHPTMYDVLSAMRERKYEREFGIYPLIPDATAYARLASGKGVPGLVADTLARLDAVRRVKTAIRGALSAMRLNISAMMNTFVDLEIQKVLNVAPSKAELRGVFAHELICDTALAFKHKELLQEYIDHVCDKYSVRAGLVTRNFARLVSFLKEEDIDQNCIMVMTPFNRVGFQMTPTKEECEVALDQCGANVLAISTLAAGSVKVNDALEYLRTKPRLKGFVIGVSNPEQARETFGKFRERLQLGST